MTNALIYKADPITVKFDIDAAAAKTANAFVEHEKGTGLTEKQLREAHKLCCQQAKASGKGKPEKKTDDQVIQGEGEE